MVADRLRGLYTRAMKDAGERYDPLQQLVSSGPLGEAHGASFRPAASLSYARALLRSGEAEAISRAHDIIEAVLWSQEVDAQHPHQGNFKWLAADADVTDLNAVQFVLRGLLPILVELESLLSVTLIRACKTAVALALGEEERLNVAATYTNIHLMSLLGLLVGGQWLEDSYYLDLGKSRWAEFVDFTVHSGAPHEYNSSNYGAVDLSTLASIATLSKEPSIALQARLLYERFWLHLGLHFHLPTGQLAGPHCRAYWLPMTTGHSMLSDLLWCLTGWEYLATADPSTPPPMESLYALELLQETHYLPPYLFPWLAEQTKAAQYVVREIANAVTGDDLITYFSPSFAIGTASKTYSIGTNCFYIEHQANYLLGHYTRPGQEPGWGMVYSRYVVNDQHWGTKGAADDRPKDANFYDQGNFAGAQLRNKAIGLYALQPQYEDVYSLKTVVVFPVGEHLQSVWVNDIPVAVDNLPLTLHVGDWLIVEDGSVFIAVYPLEPTNMGTGAGIQLERGPLGELWLTVSNYKGAAKRFWDYASLGGAFWRGNVRAGFILEIVDRDDFASVAEFLASLQAAKIEDRVNPDTVRSVIYHKDRETVRLDYDLLSTQPAGRWINGEAYLPVAHQSPLAAQSESGELAVGQATLHTNSQAVWLIAQEAIPEERRWIAVNPQDAATHLRLATPCGTLSASAWQLGRIEWRAPADAEQEIVIIGHRPIDLRVPEGLHVTYQEYSSERY